MPGLSAAVAASYSTAAAAGSASEQAASVSASQSENFLHGRSRTSFSKLSEDYIAPAEQQSAPRTPEQRQARNEANKVLNKLNRFRTRKMHKLTMIQCLSMFQEQLPIHPDSLHWCPEIWARFLKRAYKEQNTPILRQVAQKALEWCTLPIADTYEGPRDPHSVGLNPHRPEIFTLPATKEDLQLLIRNLLHADELRIERSERRRRVVADHTGLEPERVSLRKVKKREDRLGEIIKGIDTSKASPEQLLTAQRVAWQAQLKHLGPIEPFDLGPVENNRTYKLFRRVRLGERTTKAELEAAKASPSTKPVGNTSLLSQLRARADAAGRSSGAGAAGPQLNTTLDDFLAWARHAEVANLQSIISIVQDLHAEEGAEAGLDSPQNGQGRGEGKPSDASKDVTERPPTYLILAALRQLGERKDPKTALALAQHYLDTLLRDAKAGKADLDSSFSAHPACEEVDEPIADKDDNPHGHATEPVFPVFLRTGGRTYSVSAPMQPPRGHELLNAVLKAHVLAGSSISDMLASMRTLGGVRAGRLARAWESERRRALKQLSFANRGDLKHEHEDDLKPDCAPYGMSREFEAATNANWKLLRGGKYSEEDSAEIQAGMELPPPFSRARRKPAIQPEDAIALSRTRVDLDERIKKSNMVLCHPNEATFIIMLSAIRKHRDALADAIGFINSAMIVYGPPQIEPIMVPTNLHPFCVLQDTGMAPKAQPWRRLVRPPSDPYLRITTSTLTCLLRWALWTGREGNAYWLMRAGEDWIRHSREWDAALAGIPVLAYHPGQHVADGEAQGWLERYGPQLGLSTELPQQTRGRIVHSVQRLDRILSAKQIEEQKRLGYWTRYTYRFRPNAMPVSQLEVPPWTSPLTWMNIDGGRGFLGPNATGEETHRWIRILLKAGEVVPKEARAAQRQQQEQLLRDMPETWPIEESEGEGKGWELQMEETTREAEERQVPESGLTAPEVGSGRTETEVEADAITTEAEPAVLDSAFNAAPAGVGSEVDEGRSVQDENKDGAVKVGVGEDVGVRLARIFDKTIADHETKSEVDPPTITTSTSSSLSSSKGPGWISRVRQQILLGQTADSAAPARRWQLQTYERLYVPFPHLHSQYERLWKKRRQEAAEAASERDLEREREWRERGRGVEGHRREARNGPARDQDHGQEEQEQEQEQEQERPTRGDRAGRRDMSGSLSSGSGGRS
ncbi:hypothetical protein OC834_003117 [Tilletia horrida]|nr:hypothetical protein OC834_003117 [Tilletia horrida]